MTKEELQQRQQEGKYFLEFASVTPPNETIHLKRSLFDDIVKHKAEAEELALKQLEDQEKCCGNCANRKDENGECEFLTDQINIENDSEVSLCVSLVNYCRDGWKERKEE